ncbi:MAG TPA: tetratricopeptide repeat protein [Nitrospira sp.]|nr:tetratricopeptide repeat protein [Nitrospira sp.]
MADRPTLTPQLNPDDSPAPQNGSDRLESWKEIAAHLNRTLRTVQRWEKSEGLPVHRHQHDERASVYAFKSEIDGWWKTRRVQLERAAKHEGMAEAEQVSGEAQKGPRPASNAPYLRQSGWFVAIATAIVVAAAIVAVLIFQPWRRHAPLHFQSRDWVLIADFENRTGEAVLDGTLEYALERELSNSQFVNVVPHERIEDTLRLMKKPPDTKLDLDLGREVCLRDGGIRAFLTGRVEKLGSTYVLSAELVDPVHGATVASFSEEDPADSQLAAAVRRLSDRVRAQLGEQIEAIRKSDEELERVTTPSLEALQLYTQADDFMRRADPGRAEELLRQAVKLDPNFASAYNLLSWAIHNQYRPESEFLPYAERAVALSDNASAQERYFIQGSDYVFRGSDEKAAAAFEALLKINPGHVWALDNLVGSYMDLGRNEEAEQTEIRLAALRPNDLETNADAAYYLAVYQNNPNLAAPYLRRAAAVEPQDGDGWWTTIRSTWVQLFPAEQAWLRDDIPRSKAELMRVEQLHPWRDETMSPLVLGAFHMALGELKEADRYFEGVPDPYWRDASLAELAFVQGNAPALREHMQRFRKPGTQIRILLIIDWLARTGYVTDARILNKDLQDPALDGEIALAEGHRARGISEIEKVVGDTRLNRHPVEFLAAETLADAYERENDLKSAVRLLERMSPDRAKVCGPSNGVGGGIYWMRTQLKLAQLYREAGRMQDAERVEDELGKLLAYADPDFPMLVELKRLQSDAGEPGKPN